MFQIGRSHRPNYRVLKQLNTNGLSFLITAEAISKSQLIEIKKLFARRPGGHFHSRAKSQIKREKFLLQIKYLF